MHEYEGFFFQENEIYIFFKICIDFYKEIKLIKRKIAESMCA